LIQSVCLMSSTFSQEAIAGELSRDSPGCEADIQVVIALAHWQEEANLYPSFRTWYRRYPKMDHKYSPSTRLRPLCIWYVSSKGPSLIKLMSRFMGRSNPPVVNRPLHAIIHPSPSDPSQWLRQLPLNLVLTSQINVAGHKRQESDHTSSCCFTRAKTREMDDYERSQKWSICSSPTCRVECKINHGTRGYACLYIMPEWLQYNTNRC
jgi:hypothetical protein